MHQNCRSCRSQAIGLRSLWRKSLLKLWQIVGDNAWAVDVLAGVFFEDLYKKNVYATIELIEIDRYFNALMHILLMAPNWFNKMESEILYIVCEKDISIKLEVFNELFTHCHVIASNLGLNTMCPRRGWRQLTIATFVKISSFPLIPHIFKRF